MRTRILASAVMFLTVTMVSAPWLRSEPDQDVPHFHGGPPAAGEKLPAKIPKVIYQQPCYCYCDRSMRHTSLHSCFSGTHGAECSTCLKELYYTYTMYKQHKSAEQIRVGIVRGDFKTIDLATAASIN